ncbi:MAG: hypothetical protein JXB17_04105, partial [Bacteroidales bacterium]|nr:hypothetical protein [Bacteroidales bacterium]
LEVPFGKNNGEKIKNVLKYINPKGTTPIAHSLELAQFDFPKCDDCRNIIVLITDGIEACDGDPCEVSRRLQKEGIYLKPFIIGIGFDPGLKESFNCVGDFYSASNEKQFKEVLNIVITRALNSTSAQINLLDSLGKPTETNVNMTFIDNLSGKVKYNFMHTLNYKGLPDTLILDPLINYRVRINTLPPVYIDSMKLIPGKHTTFYADAHQGYLIVKSDELKYRDIKFIVREAEKSETLTYQQVNEKEKYITGNYDIEIPTIPVIKLQNVGIYQSQTTTIEIPRPGMVTFLMNAPGYGSIYKETDEGLEWIYNLNTNLLSETVLILPGNYKVVFRPRNANRTYFTVSQSFSVKSRSSSAIKL